MPKRILTAALALALLSAGAGYALTADDRAADAANVGLHGSYSFNVNDKRQLMDYSDEVFIGRVTSRVEVQEDEASTIWAVEVLDSLKGQKSTGKVQVRQLGYVDDEGRQHETEEQPLLQPGQDYLFATNPLPDGGLVLVAGSTASVTAETPAKKESLKKEYKEAMRS